MYISSVWTQLVANHTCNRSTHELQNGNARFYPETQRNSENTKWNQLRFRGTTLVGHTVTIPSRDKQQHQQSAACNARSGVLLIGR